MSDTNKKSADNQDGTKFKPSSTPVPTQFPLDSTPHRIIIKGNFYRTTEVAKTIGVTRKAVEKWRNKGWFVPDFVDHTGVFYYSIERVMQLKSVYHRDRSEERRVGKEC